jgi:hypothetical protein
MYISYNIAVIYLPIVGIWICVANSGEINPIYHELATQIQNPTIGR